VPCYKRAPFVQRKADLWCSAAAVAALVVPPGEVKAGHTLSNTQIGVGLGAAALAGAAAAAVGTAGT